MCRTNAIAIDHLKYNDACKRLNLFIYGLCIYEHKKTLYECVPKPNKMC